jgi:3-hydroxy-9,10-secoandrosta-1,3,5(10)-triene-9,17-dione monooxygenase
MSHEVLERVEALATYLDDHEEETERLGRLPDETVTRLKDAGIVRMLQPKEWGGYEADPAQFLEAVMSVASHCGASGWVAGIIGVHPWQLALFDPQVQKDVWDDDPDTWIASSYAPIGVAQRVDGGYRFAGRWGFSSGVDHAEWVFLGGMVACDDGGAGGAPERRDFLLPRGDYEIVPNSWDVVGLEGTGSKDVIVRDAFVAESHTIDVAAFHTGTAARDLAEPTPLVLMPWSVVFPNAITAAVIGIAEGALATHIRLQRDRASALRGTAASDPYGMAAIGEAASEIHACRTQMLSNVSRTFDLLQCGAREIPFELRAQCRRDQVRGSWRAVEAVDRIFANAGGGAIRRDSPMQRKWRDAHAGLNHVINNAAPVYHAYAATVMGVELPPGAIKLTI